MNWWWLSFCDARLPKGLQFLGVALVEVASMDQVVPEAWRLGINPGGEVQFLQLPSGVEPPPEFRNRLLTKAEAERLDATMGAQKRADPC